MEEFKTNFEFKGMEGNQFKLSLEQRKNMTPEQILEWGSFTLGKSKKVIQHFDVSVSYEYPWMGKMP